MKLELTERQTEDQRAFRAFVDTRIAPFADQWDREERYPAETIRELARAGYLGMAVPRSEGGTGSDMITFGLLNEELGRGCSSTRNLMTVHSMIAHVVHKRAGKHLKERYLERLIAGEIIGAFCLSEPNIGSDAKSVETTATLKGDSYVLNGSKKWITFGQVADLLLVFAQCDGKPTAFLVDGDTPGLTREPISGMLGSRASMLAELRFENCEIPRSNMLGGIGFGLATIATAALDIGRYTVAWGSVGIGQACLEASVRYSSERKQFGVPLREHQLISQMVCDMLTNVRAARLLCLRAGYTKDINDPSTVMETWVAKYFASTTAVKAALDAVQIHGANGCSGDYPVQRYLRDAKIMEIIEGSTQLQQVMISRSAYQS
jgi:alkylation response protein AidB-like acyl-CoA dehydrogenase